jgi:hypothetical protein
MTKKHLKNIEKYNEKIEEEAEKLLDEDSNSGDDGSIEGLGSQTSQNPPQFDDTYVSPVKNDTFLRDDIFYAKIYNTLFELKRQYPNKYEFVRNTERMKREWVRWTQEQYENDFVFCYTKWFGRVSKVNDELIRKFVF